MFLMGQREVPGINCGRKQKNEFQNLVLVGHPIGGKEKKIDDPQSQTESPPPDKK